MVETKQLSEVVGVVLGGGASRRMGHDKASLRVDGETLLEAAVRRLRGAVDEVVVADRGRGLLDGVPSVPDGPGAGPAAGILGAAMARPGKSLLVLACDLPNVPRALLAELAARPNGDLWMPAWDSPGKHRPGKRRREPLCTLYRPAAVSVLARRVARGELALHPLAEEPELALRELDGADLAAFGPPAEIFRNLNTPADLERHASAGAVLANPAAER